MPSAKCKYIIFSLLTILSVPVCFPSPLFSQTTEPMIPPVFPDWEEQSEPYIDKQPIYIVPRIQNRLKRFLEVRGKPIAGVMLVEVSTGNVLAMAQGADPRTWGSQSNTNLHIGFPAASLFKTIVAAAALENINFDSRKKIPLDGGCGRVSPKGYWMRNEIKGRRFQLNLRRAYGSSCNGFFAKLAVNEIGLGPILNMADRFGWGGQPIPANFDIPLSPLKAPDPRTSSAHMVGRFAAGFGYVGLSVAHAAWQMLAIANSGYPKPLKLFEQDLHKGRNPYPYEPIISQETAQELLSIMDATVLGGTATSSFKRGAYRKLRRDIGGKTGTLTGGNPAGVTTWFAGVYPLEKPEIVVVSVVVLEDLWHVKAAGLAAEAVAAYVDHQKISKLAKSKGNPNTKN